MPEEDYTDLEYANVITLVDPLWLTKKSDLLLTNLELYATKCACKETGKFFSEIASTSQYYSFLNSINKQCGYEDEESA